jgi:hypothetical protein
LLRIGSGAALSFPIKTPTMQARHSTHGKFERTGTRRRAISTFEAV